MHPEESNPVGQPWGQTAVPSNENNISSQPQPQPQSQPQPVVSQFDPPREQSVEEVQQPVPVTPQAFLQETAQASQANTSDSVAPVPVVQVLSPRGVEYVMLTIALFTAAIGLTAALLCLVNGQTGIISLSVPVALLLTGLPIFAALFIRLKRAELAAPSLKLDQSKRRSTQATQIISFIVSLFTLVSLIVSIFIAIGGEADSLGKSIASALIVFIIFTGILAYYWWDEHRA